MARLGGAVHRAERTRLAGGRGRGEADCTLGARVGAVGAFRHGASRTDLIGRLSASPPRFSPDTRISTETPQTQQASRRIGQIYQTSSRPELLLEHAPDEEVGDLNPGHRVAVDVRHVLLDRPVRTFERAFDRSIGRKGGRQGGGGDQAERGGSHGRKKRGKGTAEWGALSRRGERSNSGPKHTGTAQTQSYQSDPIKM